MKEGNEYGGTNPKYDVSRDSRLFTARVNVTSRSEGPFLRLKPLYLKKEKPRCRRLVKNVQKLPTARYEVFAEMTGNSLFGFPLRVGVVSSYHVSKPISGAGGDRTTTAEACQWRN